jgi:hypothetical protein
MTNSFIKKEDLTATNMVYNIHDNGGRPFRVISNNKGIDIYRYDVDKKSYDMKILTIKKFIGYWKGYDSGKHTKYHGNSILVKETKTSYVSIGYNIQKFTIPASEEIFDYVSPVGNSDVPYPVAFSENNVYFMLDMVYCNINQFNIDITPKNAEDFYSAFYTMRNKLVKHKLSSKILYKRIMD